MREDRGILSLAMCVCACDVRGDRVRRSWLVLVVVIVVAACTQGSTTSTEPSLLPNVFDKVDIGGYRLAYQCVGSGSPTIIAEAGYNTGGTTEFAGVLEPLGQISRVCTYDRAGTGNSDDRPAADAKGLTSEGMSTDQ